MIPDSIFTTLAHVYNENNYKKAKTADMLNIIKSKHKIFISNHNEKVLEKIR